MQESVNQDREKYIGGSDIPIIMELSPFKTRFDLLLEKAGYKANEFTGNIYTDYGNALEPVIRDFINSGLSEPFTEGKHVREAEAGEIIGARIHTDGENTDTILEIKTTSTDSNNIDTYKLYIVQLLYYMVMTGKPNGLLAVYIRPDDMSRDFDVNRLRLFNIARGEAYTEKLIEEINEALERFIDDLGKVKENPFINEVDLLPSEIPDITKQIIALESQLDFAKKAEKKVKDLKERLKKAMQASGVKTFDTPNGYKLTLVDDTEPTTKTTTELDKEALKKDLPELFRPVEEGGYMVTKTEIKKGRAGYVLITAPNNEKGG